MNQRVIEQHLGELMQLLLASPDDRSLILQAARDYTVSCPPPAGKLEAALRYLVENAGSLEVRTAIKKSYCDGVLIFHYMCYPAVRGVAHPNSQVTVRKVTLSAIRGRKTSTSIYDDTETNPRHASMPYIKAAVMLASVITEMSKR